MGGDPEILELLLEVEPAKRQPNLPFASVTYLEGSSRPSYEAFRKALLTRAEEVLDLLRTRHTQTNEVARCATLIPAFSLFEGPLALLEVGASAGLCLYPDHFSYVYGEAKTLGDPSSTVHLRCAVKGGVPLPQTLPDVVWRAGIDLHPIDLKEPDEIRWLRSFVWPDQPERLARLDAAIEIARNDPPFLVQGDAVDNLPSLAAKAPSDATLVIFHSATLNYLSRERREEFASLVGEIDGVWVSNEAVGVIHSLRQALVDVRLDRATFVIGLGSDRPLALSDPHGQWIEWMEA